MAGSQEHWQGGGLGCGVCRRCTLVQGITMDIGRREEEEWRASVEAKPRLRSYKLVKVKLELEEYLQFTVGKTKAA